jgi:hypothetical protein
MAKGFSQKPKDPFPKNEKKGRKKKRVRAKRKLSEKMTKGCKTGKYQKDSLCKKRFLLTKVKDKLEDTGRLCRKKKRK